MSKVIFVQRMIPDYRLPFFEQLHETLKDAGIDFYVTTGESLSEDCLNDSVIAHSWIKKHKNHYLYKQVHIHRIQRLETYDLVIVMQENSHLVNYLLLLRRYLTGSPLIAFYGHGRNVNTQGKRLREYLKKKILLLPDWWFAYTALTERIVVNNGYDKNKITVVNNAIDDTELKSKFSDQTEEERLQLRNELGININSNVALYCGRLIEIKVSFLVEALDLIRKNDDKFEAIIVGTGPLEDKIRAHSEKCHWLHYIGPVYGHDRAKYFCVSDIFLMPGMVGLAVLDAFSVGLPVITTDCKVHSPEIEYLEQGVNGFIAPNNVEQYAETVCELFVNNDMLATMKKSARQSSEKYSIEKMADNFSLGIQRVLKNAC